MEVTTEEEAQAVLLEGMEGTQYITIQRADGETLGKGVPLFTLNGELISEGMVVDMINGVGTDYTTATQYYETEDLLPHVLTEEDRRLAAALVAVQLQQQQKQQQIHGHQNTNDPTLQDVTQLGNLPPVNTYSIEAIQESNPPPVYPSLQTFKRGIQHIKEEFINVKCEDDVDISAESSEDAIAIAGPKRSLPHKKRIPRKLKQQIKKNVMKKDSIHTQDITSVETITKTQANAFKCELCGNKFNGQLKFFEHLKSHYEPIKELKKISQPVNNVSINVPNMSESSVQGVIQNTIEEFSEPEDLMEGIRGVVEETGARIDDDDDDDDDDNNDEDDDNDDDNDDDDDNDNDDDDDDNDDNDDANDVNENQLPDSSNGSSLWTIPEVRDHIEQQEIEETSTINEQDIFEKDKVKPPDPIKKKKSKSRKTTDELTCPNCDRSFHHKNSLVYHMRSHSGERPHQCEVCGKSFFAASALKVHKRLHSGDKPYKCEDCGRHFRQWGDLKYHSTSLHSEQRQFQCEYCGKDFARKYSLIVHRRIHTGEKNYRCEYCNKTFRASSYLQNHRRIHTGEKPHPCDVCGKPFRVRSDMKRHMLTHSRTSNRTDRLQAKNTMIKTITNASSNSSDDDGMNKTNRTINEIVHELKLEVDPNTAVVELVGTTGNTDDNPETILPHVSVQTLEYATIAATQSSAGDINESTSDRDPLEAVVARTSDTLNFDMQVFY